MNKCNCYHEEYNRQVCWGTKEREECSCDGDETKCNFYPEKRATAQAEKTIKNFQKTQRIFEVEAVQRLGEQIGYGHLMWLASALWRRNLVKKYGDGHENGAFLPTISILLNEEGLDIFQQQIGVYDEIVKDVLD